MNLLALLLVGLAAWLIWTGRLQRLSGLDGIMLALAIMGAAMAAKGRIWVGGGLLLAAFYYGWRRWPQLKRAAARVEPVHVADARELLGLGTDFDEAAVREAHRRLIARVHPDAGGTSALAEKLNAARNVLLSHLNQPR